MNLDYSTVFSLAPFVNENIVTIIGICLLIGAMAKSVRCGALFRNGDFVSKHWPNMFLTTKLDERENPTLNLASSYDGEIKPKQDGWVALLVNTPMVKTILFKVYLPGVSSHGLQLACYRLNVVNPYLELLDRIMVYPQPNCVNNFKVESGQPKGVIIRNIRTTGLPKVGNGYGNRGIVVPVYSCSIYSPMKIGSRGRVPGLNLRLLSTSAGSPVQIKSDISEKLLKLAEYVRNTLMRR